MTNGLNPVFENLKDGDIYLGSKVVRTKTILGVKVIIWDWLQRRGDNFYQISLSGTGDSFNSYMWNVATKQEAVKMFNKIDEHFIASVLSLIKIRKHADEEIKAVCKSVL